jgi:RNA polymerase sigma factor (sigma-70 family)
VSAAPTEAGLLARVRAGHPEALSELFAKHGQRVLDVAYRITGSRDQAEDVVQDVFIGLPEALRAFDARGTFEGWLRRLSVRTAMLRLRSEQRRKKWQGKAAEDRPTRTRPEPVEDRLTLEWALARMPEELRVVYILREVEGYAHAEIAELVGISRGASEVRLHRARKFLRERLKNRI